MVASTGTSVPSARGSSQSPSLPGGGRGGGSITSPPWPVSSRQRRFTSRMAPVLPSMMKMQSSADSNMRR